MTKIAKLCTLFLLAGTVQLSAQEPTAPVPFIDSIEVTVVNVEVFVTDRKGQRVMGLAREDFEIYEDRRPVEITNFYVVEEGRPRPAEGESQQTEQSAQEVAARPVAAEPQEVPNRRDVAELPEDQRLSVVIYVDNANTTATNRNRGFIAVRNFLRHSMPPKSRVMIVTYERSLHERLSFTTDIGRVTRTLLEIEELVAFGGRSRRDRRDVLESIFDEEVKSSIEISGLATSYVETAYFDLNKSVDALKRVVDSLAGVPGRKAILYLSDGLALRAGADIFEAIDQRFGDGSALHAQRYDISRRIRSVVSQANANRIVFYPVDTAGLRTHERGSAATFQVKEATSVESVHLSNIQGTLHNLAVETGGQAIVNTNRIAPMLERVADDFETYYSLGFRPAAGRTGRYREIEVKVKDRKGLRLRHREGYRDSSIDKQMGDATLAALRFGFSSNPLQASLRFGSSEARKGGFLLPLEIEVPMSQLTFVPRGEVHFARLRLSVAARDLAGEISPVQHVPVAVEIPAAKFESAMQSPYRIRHALITEAGRQLVAVGIRDEIGGTVAIVSQGVHVGP